MKKFLLSLVLLLMAFAMQAQLTGIKSIPGDYPTIEAAISALNTQGVGTGGVIFNVAAGHTETLSTPTGGTITTLTSSASNPITFQKSGTGNNPKITAGTGTGTLDGIIKFAGCDYVTFDGIDLQENPANTTATTQMEWGYAILKASATDGSQNITIKNCAITMSTNTAAYAIYSNNHTPASSTQLTVTAPEGTNSNNKFFNVNISNSYNGIYLYGYNASSPYQYYDQNNEIGVGGTNSISSLGGGTTASYGIYCIYQNNLKIANNNITGTSLNTSGAQYGIYIGTSVNSNIDVFNNTISLTHNGTGSFYGIYSLGAASGTSNTTNIYNNSILNCNAPNLTSGTWYGLYMYGGLTSNFYNNTVSNCTIGSGTATATGSIYGIYHYSSPTSVGTMNIYNNSVNNLNRIQSTAGSGSGYYFYISGGNGTAYIYNNSVTNITTSTTSTQYIFYNLYSGTKYTYDNIISNINGPRSTVYALYNGNGVTGYFYRNQISKITGNTTSAIIYGIYQSSGTTNYYYNNFISELYAPDATGNPAIYGAYISGTTVGFYNNTIYLDASSTGASFGTVGIYASTTPTVELINNLVVNNSTPGSTGRVVAHQRSSTTTTTFANTSNNNSWYAGTPSTNRLIFYDGTNSDQNLAAYKARFAPRETNAVSENPPFVNVATSPYDLHLQTNVATQIESGGLTVSTPVNITTDFDGNPRYPNPGYPNNPLSPASAPDIGADEFGGLLLDLNPPTISVTPLPNTPQTTARTLIATITDASGVPTSGIGLPVLYWRINTGPWNAATATSLGGGQYSFTFGAGVVLNDVVQYYIVAQDIVTPTPNLACSPSAGASGFTANPPAVSTPPTTPYSYSITSTPLVGDYLVGTGGAYPTLTAAVNDLNLRGVGGHVRFLLTDATYNGETLPIVIYVNNINKPAANQTVTIKPNTSVNATISGSSASGPVINIRDSYIIIDGSNTTGGTTRDLTITNTSTTSPQVILISSGSTPITNSTVKNCVLINGANTSSAVVLTSNTGTGGYFNNITIQNNSIQRAYIGIYFWADAVTGNGNGTIITQNDLNINGANSIRLVGIYVQGADGVTVSNNNIGNMNNTTDASNYTGIWLATGTVNTSVIGNIIDGMASTTAAGRGIAVSSGNNAANLLIEGNIINNITTSYSSAPFGIYIFSTTGGVNISKNKVSTLLNSNTSGYGARGINVSTGLANSNINIINNTVADIKCTGDASLTYWGIGIAIDGSTGGVNSYFNSVNLSGSYSGYSAGTITAALYTGTAPVASLNIRDNIFVNSFDNTNSTTDKAYAIYAASTNTAFTSIDYNDYFVQGTPGVLGYLGADKTTLADWKAATGQDVNSINVSPDFASATNLTPSNVAMDNLGVTIAGITTDINNVTRTSPPDMGAIEFGVNPVVITTAAGSITSSAATLNGTINANGLVVSSFFDYGTTTAYGSSVAGTPASVTGSTTTPISAPISGLTPNTTYHFRARGVTSGGVTVYGQDLTFVTLGPPPTVVTNAATSITTTGATLNGTVNANGSSSTVIFEYGLTTSYGSTITAAQSPVTGNTNTSVSANISGLAPNTTYHFRVVGTNASGTSYGNDLTFTTAAAPPTAVTNAATNITTNSATLNGTVTANNATTTVTFEWGTTTAYGNTANATPSTVNGSTATAVSANISGLTTGTTYHFRVKAVNAGGTSYGNDMTFTTGCPAPGAAGTITGSTSVCQSSSGHVYSVPTIVNATSYVWTVPTGATITSGSGTNTITVSFGASAVSGNITVYGTSSCGNGAPSSLAVTVNPRPVPTITGPTSVCGGSTGNVYTTQSGMTGYTWTVSAGGTITAGAGTNAITVTWNNTGAQTVTVTYTNPSGCSALSPGTLNVTVNANPTPTITGPNNLCQGATGATYTTEAGMSNYVWNVSSGGTITSGSGTNSITVTWNGGGAQTVSVNYNNASGCSAPNPAVYNVTVNPTPTPSIMGDPTPCVSTSPYIYYTESGMTSYQWSISSGGTIVSGQGTSTVQVVWNTPGLQSLSLQVVSPTGCTMSAPYTKTIMVNPLPNTAGTITGPTTLCAGSTANYSVAPILNALSYSWTVPAGASITSGAGTNNITVSFGTNASSGDITVAGVNNCGTGVPSSLAVTVNPLPGAAGAINGPTSVCQGQSNVTFSVAPIPNATSYVWSVPSGVSITSGTNTNTIKVSFTEGAASGNFSVYGTNACGNGTPSPNFYVTVNPIPPTPTITLDGNTLNSSAPNGNQWYRNNTPIPGATQQTYVVTESGSYYVVVTLNGCSSAPSNIIEVTITGITVVDETAFSIFPNPNNGQFTINVNIPGESEFHLVLFNSIGEKIWEQKGIRASEKWTQHFDMNTLRPGIYNAVLFNDKTQITRRVIIQR